MEYTDATDFLIYFRLGRVFAVIRMKDTREAPMTFRLNPEVEAPFSAALETLGWTRTKLLNEALLIALPVIMERQAARFQPPTKQPTAEAGAAAVRVARKPKRA